MACRRRPTDVGGCGSTPAYYWSTCRMVTSSMKSATFGDALDAMPNRRISVPAKLRGRRVKGKLIGLLLAGIAIVAAAGTYWIESPGSPVHYATTAVMRG